MGPSHPATLVSLTNLADQMESLGRMQQAAEIKRTILDRQQGSLGSMHADTLFTQTSLAVQLGKMGEHQESAHLHAEVSLR